nr:transposase [Streptomyces sp. ISL-98]
MEGGRCSGVGLPRSERVAVPPVRAVPGEAGRIPGAGSGCAWLGGGSGVVRELVAEREWLTVFLLPAYSPDLNPVEGVWAHVKRSLTNLAVTALDQLEVLVRNRLKRLQYRPHTLDGFIAGTGLTLETSAPP